MMSDVYKIIYYFKGKSIILKKTKRNMLLQFFDMGKDCDSNKIKVGETKLIKMHIIHSKLVPTLILF